MTGRVFSGAEISSIARQRWQLEVRGPTGSKGEYHGPCPTCGGDARKSDRLVIFPDGGYYFCRQCGDHGWLEDRQSNWRPDPARAQQYARMLAEAEAARQQKLRDWQDGFNEGYIRGWHDAMTLYNREYWEGEGVHQWAIDFYGLGYCPDKVFQTKDRSAFFHSPCYTIPIRSPNDWAIVNIQNRLTNIPQGEGKYRQEPGVPAASFYADPQMMQGRAIVVEGAKKAIVVFEAMHYEIQVVGWPSMMPALDLVEQLKSFELVYLILDPGPSFHKAVQRVATVLGDRMKCVEMSVKPDDAIVHYGLKRDGLDAFLRQARRV